MRSRFGVILIFFVITVPVLCKGRIVEGRAYSSYRLEAARLKDFIPEYANNGFSQTVVRSDGFIIVTVNVNAESLNSRSPYPLDLQDLPGDVRPYLEYEQNFRLRGKLDGIIGGITDTCESEYEVVRGILIWISENIEYTANGNREHDALSVLEKGEGHCVGRINLALALLRRAGIPSREVHGLFLDRIEDKGIKLGMNRFHRWLEVYYPDGGWVFCDPGRYVNFVGTEYIVISPDKVNPYAAACHRIDRTELYDGVVTVDVYPEAPREIYIRSNDRARYGGAVVGILEGFPVEMLNKGEVLIFPRGSERGILLKLEGKHHFSFTELQPGRSYVLSLRFPGMNDRHIDVTPAGNLLKTINIEFSPGNEYGT